MLDPFTPSAGPLKPPRYSSTPSNIPEPEVVMPADSHTAINNNTSTNPFNYDPFGDDFDNKPIHSSSSSTTMLPPPQHEAEHFPAMQTLPPAPALDEFSLLLSSTQAPSGSTTAAANAIGSSSAISASDSDLDSFFDSLNRPVKK